MVQVHLGPRTFRSHPTGVEGGGFTSEGMPTIMKKLLILAAIAGGAYLVYRQLMASRAEDDLWSEATAAPDLSAAYQRTETPAVVDDVATQVDPDNQG